ncbi:MAG: amidase [Planctomycetota bacterium]|jgi:amidase/aspartyl-tRNA(Asn)/glutamyl-tRNA(Gln) amidotransferase subunit A
MIEARELCFLPATDLAAAVANRDVSPVEVVDAFLARIDERNPALNAYVTLLADRARAAARRAEAAVLAGDVLGPLHGVPIAIKDLFDALAGVPNTFGSRVFAGFVPDESQVYVERLQAAGAIILGKTNTPEFGHKGVTDNLLFGATSTPFALGLNAGGSSGGSAAAVADGLAALAQGSDAGGSVRIPAACCHVVGLKASFGRVPGRYRPDGFLSTPFVHAGPLARTVADAALMLSVMAGPHAADPFSLPDDGCDPRGAVGRSIEGCRVAWSPDLDVYPVDPAVAAVAEQAVAALGRAGARVERVSLGLTRGQAELCELWMDEMGVLYAAVAESLKAAGVDLLGEHRAELCPDFAAIIERGQRQGAVAAKLGDVARTEVFDAVQRVFEDHDLLVSPTLAVTPFPNRRDGLTVGPTEVAGEAVDPLLGWCLTYLFNFTGHPAASVPAGLTADGLPVGLQIVGRRFADEDVIAAAAAFERARPWAHLYPGRQATG